MTDVYVSPDFYLEAVLRLQADFGFTTWMGWPTAVANPLAGKFRVIADPMLLARSYRHPHTGEVKAVES